MPGCGGPKPGRGAAAAGAAAPGGRMPGAPIGGRGPPGKPANRCRAVDSWAASMEAAVNTVFSVCQTQQTTPCALASHRQLWLYLVQRRSCSLLQAAAAWPGAALALCRWRRSLAAVQARRNLQQQRWQRRFLGGGAPGARHSIHRLPRSLTLYTGYRRPHQPAWERLGRSRAARSPVAGAGSRQARPSAAWPLHQAGRGTSSLSASAFVQHLIGEPQRPFHLPGCCCTLPAYWGLNGACC